MSDTDDRDALAAEYALGVLEGEERARALRLMDTDPGFVRLVESWNQQLAPLSRLADDASPPADLWARIDATVTPVERAPVANDNVVPLRRIRFWQATTGVSLAIAASLALFLVVRPPAEPRHMAVLAPIQGAQAVLVATLEPSGALTIRPNGTIAVPTDRDLELWSLAKGATRPTSLGVLPASGRQLTAKLNPDTQLLVSLEPRGGSPTGLPTGPVLYGGTLTVVN